MTGVDQDSAFRSMSQALVPGKDMIDGRTEADRLDFFCRFASLISFYDSTNTLSGNWSPFLLKDPVFLVAYISKTKIDRFYSPYYNACLKLEKSLSGLHSNYDHNDTIAFNQVFDQLTLMFMRIERWTHYMQLADEYYDLKHYLILQVRERFAPLFWALQSLREALFISSALPDIDRVYYYLFDRYDELTWKISRDKIPYWQLLQMKGPKIDEKTISGIEWPDSEAMKKAEKEIEEKTYYYYSGFWENPSLVRESAKSFLVGEIARDCHTALQGLGDELFNFTHTIVHNATTELQKINKKRSRYPDTTLLRSFLDMLSVHQDQLNGLAEKHLQFYYKDILKQSEKPARPDKALVYATLSNNSAAYVLPAGTGFNGGVDANKNPIVFSTTEDVCLNPAAIAAAYTLSAYLAAGADLSSYYLQNIASPTIPQANESGALQSWQTFGGKPPADLKPVSTSLAFASPMLLLREGQRTITFVMACTGTISQSMLNAANYYLSTGTAWQELYVNPGTEPDLIKSSVLVTGASTNTITLRIDLPASQSAITAFTSNPDGYSSPWPMFKITFNGMDNPSGPPQITNITISTTVTGMTGTLKLYNDNGAISTKNPYQAFGSLPLLNSNFIIGSDEIFSKPATALYLTLKWNNLPAAFDTYYSAYNSYLEKYSGELDTSVAAGTVVMDNAVPLEKKHTNRLIGFFLVILAYLRQPFKWMLSKLVSADVSPECKEAFNNTRFTALFSALQQSDWISLTPVQLGSISVDAQNDIVSTSYTPGESCCAEEATPPAVTLFGATDKLVADKKECVLLDTSFFEMTSNPGSSCIVTPDPDLQDQALSYTGSGNAGFVKLSLASPNVGFGSSVYGNVVTWVAMQNAMMLKKKGKIPVKLPYSIPNPPLAPKLSALVVHYEASQSYSLTSGAGPYPFQCFMYTPFETMVVYDNSVTPPVVASSLTGNLCGPGKNPPTTNPSIGVPLFPALAYQGALYLGLKNLLTPNALNFYFQMAQSYGSISQLLPPDLYYLCKKGWNALPIVQDSTNTLTCSGIIVADIPQDITAENNRMPAGNYWITMAASSVPDYYPQTVMMNTNGFLLQRSGSTFLNSTLPPVLPAASITKPVTAVPQIKTISQPFASFGGKAAETSEAMNLRISNRLKTKGRAVTSEDYFRLIRQKFDTIYYSRTIYNTATNGTEIYVVRGFDSWQEPGAFVPLVTECELSEIEQYLLTCSSPFANLTVSNFKLEPVQITAVINIESGYSGSGVIKSVKQALNVFLSPWIASSDVQITIGKKIALSEVTNFIASVPGVVSISNLSVAPGSALAPSKEQQQTTAAIASPIPVLIVSSMEHNITSSP